MSGAEPVAWGVFSREHGDLQVLHYMPGGTVSPRQVKEPLFTLNAAAAHLAADPDVVARVRDAVTAPHVAVPCQLHGKGLRDWCLPSEPGCYARTTDAVFAALTTPTEEHP